MIICSRSLLLLALLGLSKIGCLPSSDSIYDTVKEFQKPRCGSWKVYQDETPDKVPLLKSYNYNQESVRESGCKDSTIYYPQIGFTSYQLPHCVRDKDTGLHVWMITVRDADSWQGRRERFEGLYCRLDEKLQPIQGACLPLLPSMTACPAKTPGAGGCGKPRMSMTGYFECDPGLELYYTPSRRIPLVPVESVACNVTDGEYVVTMRNNQSVRGFTDETWLICKEERFRPMFEEYDHKELRRNPWLKFFIGGCVGAIAYFIIMLIFIATCVAIYFFVKFLIKFFKDRAEAKKKKEAEEKEKKASAGATLNFDQNLPTKGKPKLSLKAALSGKGKQAPPPRAPLSEIPPIPEQPKFPTERKPPAETLPKLLDYPRLHDDLNDEQTCIEPNLAEVDILREQERLKDVTDEDDMTGKEVKDIEKED